MCELWCSIRWAEAVTRKRRPTPPLTYFPEWISDEKFIPSPVDAQIHWICTDCGQTCNCRPEFWGSKHKECGKMAENGAEEV